MWLNSGRSFGEHVARATEKAGLVANCLSRILPNLGGAGGRVRRLYVATVHSVLLYSAPIWWQKVCKSAILRGKMEAVQRIIALRASRGYRTVAYMGATTLAGIPSAHLLARYHAETYEGVCQARKRLGFVPPNIKRAIKQQGREALLQHWKDWVEDPRYR
ncbi:uncharacterized protein LOC112455416 [Temnothorax curvispinosus]|uniref:Uncharacterized protein LOC112455416 n=1 Tax=Temnothorax curvispinosus TaxID=300111 RepID=A0A6J1PUS6_9HYME|nr:uncharacterized protein LOC112455416 [Temnothorax curvispinosus]